MAFTRLCKKYTINVSCSMDSAEDSGMESSNYCGFLENEIFIPKWIMDRGEELVKESTPFIISYSLIPLLTFFSFLLYIF